MPLHTVIFCCAHGSASASENLKESGHKSLQLSSIGGLKQAIIILLFTQDEVNAAF